MSFLYPTLSTIDSALVIANQSYIEGNNYDEEDENYCEDEPSPPPTPIFSTISSIPMTTLPLFATIDNQIPSSVPFYHNEQGTFRLCMNVDSFQPNELNVSIRHGRLIVRGRHVVRAQTQPFQSLTTNPIGNANDDIEPDFVAKEFKRTFIIPPNTDISKAHAQFYSRQQLLIVEIPFQNSTNESQTTTNRRRIRSMDVFLTIICILLLDRAICLTVEQFINNEYLNHQYV